MDISTESKFNLLANDIQQLNSLIELTFLSNQYSNVKEFLNALKSFIFEKAPHIKLDFGYCDLNGIIRNPDSAGPEFCLDTNRINLYEELQYCENKFGMALATDDDNNVLSQVFEKYNLRLDTPCAIKLFTNHSSIYAFCLVSYKNDELSTEVELSLLEKVFHFIEPILYKYIKKQKEDVEIKNLHKTLNQISILYSISQAVNFIDDLKRLLEIVLSKALDTLEAERASLMFYDYADNSLQIKFVYGLEDKNVEADINNGMINCTKIKMNEGIAGKVFAQKKSIISNLGQNDPRYVQSHSIANVETLLCVPLIAKGEAIGVINIANKKNGNFFNKSDLDFMEALANQAAIAIDNSKLYEMATRDGLTKLYIYRHFYTLLENEIRRSQRYEHLITFIMIDIDNFKRVNDTYGHLIGDQVLKEVANVISGSVRKVDIAARYGGEEFAVILPETSIEHGKAIANRIRNNVSELEIELPNGQVIRPTISAGVSEFPTCAEDEMTLIELADIALYQSKEFGKNVVFEYTPFGCQVVDKNLGLEEVDSDVCEEITSDSIEEGEI